MTNSPSAMSSENVSSAWTGAGLRLVDLRRAPDADLRVVGRAQNHPSSPGFAYCMNSTTAPSTQANATVRKSRIRCRVERLREDRRAHRAPPVRPHAVGDVRLRPERTGHGLSGSKRRHSMLKG